MEVNQERIVEDSWARHGGMDDRIEHDTPGTWLAVTSLSFDISVLELLWTVTRGFKVVIYRDNIKNEGEGASSKPIDFGIFMWGNDDGEGPEKYRLMQNAANPSCLGDQLNCQPIVS